MRYDRKLESVKTSHTVRHALTYLSSSPPSFLTIFRRENTVPKMSFASSSALNTDRFGTGMLVTVDWDIGRAALAIELDNGSRHDFL